ncbi:MAG: pyruvate dehydrogenase complex dihydrolipoamide acetyltransferase [Verrucomicrobiota bacterium JB023]|nr:pyruvate dehydrogenase complex dihydrolipoamide acetyltransferase [Verrucomicrobiota bacterium JB023]
MPTNIEMPKLSDTMTEGTILRWLKQVGDRVEIGDEILEIETDKATMPMEAFDEGTLSKIIVGDGEKAPVGTKIGVLLEEGEEAGDDDEEESTSSEPAKSPDSQPEESQKTESITAGSAEATSSSAPAAGTTESGERIKASPLARKIAESKGIDLSTLTGSGPGGRIVKADVESAKAGGSSSAPAASAPAPSAPAVEAVTATASDADEKIPLSNMRKIIADRLLTSKVTIPHFYLHVEADTAALMGLRKQINEQAEKTTGNKYTVNDFILKAVIEASKAVPEVNASFAGDHIIQFASIGVSVAVAVEDGLVTPVIKEAGDKSLLQISREVKDIAARARDKKLRPDDFEGGTITVSNLGSYGVDSFDAIINPPQAAILSVGGIVQKAVVKDGQIVPGQRMNLGLSCDHRVVDGAVGAQFLAEVKKLIENPALMLV